MNQKIRFKKIKDWEEYDKGFCLASRCKKESSITIATMKEFPVEYGLCPAHWEAYCED